MRIVSRVLINVPRPPTVLTSDVENSLLDIGSSRVDTVTFVFPLICLANVRDAEHPFREAWLRVELLAFLDHPPQVRSRIAVRLADELDRFSLGHSGVPGLNGKARGAGRGAWIKRERETGKFSSVAFRLRNWKPMSKSYSMLMSNKTKSMSHLFFCLYFIGSLKPIYKVFIWWAFQNQFTFLFLFSCIYF